MLYIESIKELSARVEESEESEIKELVSRLQSELLVWLKTNSTYIPSKVLEELPEGKMLYERCVCDSL